MKKNKVHCLIINQSPVLTTELSRAISHNQNKGFVEVIDSKLHQLKMKVINHQIGLLFIAKTSAEPSFETVSKILRQYSPDTILVVLTAKNKSIQQDMLGVEYCDLSLNTASTSTFILSNLLHYAQTKKDFRDCKHLLSVVDQRNRWLVNATHEPIAYIYQGTHVHANPAYLGLFGFQSVAELMGTAINDLIPMISRAVFTRFINKQKKSLGTKQSLLVTMQGIDKQTFRADIRVSLAVINGTQCLQLWVHKLQLEGGISAPVTVKGRMRANVINMMKNRQNDEAKKKQIFPVQQNKQKVAYSAQKTTQAAISVGHNVKINKAKKGEVSVLKEKLNLRQLIALAQQKQFNKLDIQLLQEAHIGTMTHYFVDMSLNQQQVAVPVSQQLRKSYGMNVSMFQDYVTLTSLISELKQKGKAGEHYIVEPDIANLQDKRFSLWLSIQLQQLPAASAQIVFLLPYIYCKQNSAQLTRFLYSLKNTSAYIGLSDFIPSVTGMNVIKHFQVRYMSFDRIWLDRIRENKYQRQVLLTLTQKLERSGIEVIVSPSKAA